MGNVACYASLKTQMVFPEPSYIAKAGLRESSAGRNTAALLKDLGLVPNMHMKI